MKGSLETSGFRRLLLHQFELSSTVIGHGLATYGHQVLWTYVGYSRIWQNTVEVCRIWCYLILCDFVWYYEILYRGVLECVRGIGYILIWYPVAFAFDRRKRRLRDKSHERRRRSRMERPAAVASCHETRKAMCAEACRKSRCMKHSMYSQQSKKDSRCVLLREIYWLINHAGCSETTSTNRHFQHCYVMFLRVW